MSPYQAKKKEQKKRKAIALYKQGMTLREVGKALSMSHEWVGQVVREKLSTVPILDNS